MTPEAQRQKAIALVLPFVRRSHRSENRWCFRKEGRCLACEGITINAVNALIDAGMLCSHDLDAVEAKVERQARTVFSVGSSAYSFVQTVNAIWRKAMSS